jgi:hypothetical protein
MVNVLPQLVNSIFQTLELTGLDDFVVDSDQDLLSSSDQVKTFVLVMADMLVLVVSRLEIPYQVVEVRDNQ